jgi:type I restriction enzyme S subunit
VQKIISDLNVGSTNQIELPRSVIAELKIPLPPITEQRRIVAQIDELFAEIEEGEAALERARQGLDTWRRALLKAAVTGELTRDWREANRPAEAGADLLARTRAGGEYRQGKGQGRRRTVGMFRQDATPFEIPEEWAWGTIGEIVGTVDYGTSEKCVTEPIGVPVLRMGNIQEGELDLRRLKYLASGKIENLFLNEGDLLFNRTNSAELVGKTAIYRGRPSPCSFASYLVRIQIHGCHAEFVNFWLNSAYAKMWIAENKSQQVGQANLSAGKLRHMPVPIPSLAEQQEISRLLNEHFEIAETGVRSAEGSGIDSAALRQSILKAAFEGRLVPQDPADEPASVLLARLRHSNPQAVTRRRQARTKEPFSHPSLPGLTRQSLDPRVEPGGDD